MVCSQRGSLLINLGVVVAIILVLVSLSIPSISWTRRFVVRTEIEKLHAIFYYLQQRALAVNQDQELIFDSTHNKISGGISRQALSDAVEFGFIAGASGPPSHPKKQISAPVTFKNNKAIFYADGTISAGTVYLVDREHKYMYALTSPISQISFIRMYCYQNGSWILIQ